MRAGAKCLKALSSSPPKAASCSPTSCSWMPWATRWPRSRASITACLSPPPIATAPNMRGSGRRCGVANTRQPPSSASAKTAARFGCRPGHPVRRGSGAPYKVLKVATDITAARLQAADHEGQIAAISKSQAVIAFTMDRTVTDANANFLTALGYTMEEIRADTTACLSIRRARQRRIPPVLGTPAPR